MTNYGRRFIYDDCLYKFLKKYIENIGGNNAELREKWIARKLKQKKSGAKILDVGADEGRYKKYVSHLEYVAQYILWI